LPKIISRPPGRLILKTASPIDSAGCSRLSAKPKAHLASWPYFRTRSSTRQASRRMRVQGLPSAPCLRRTTDSNSKERLRLRHARTGTCGVGARGRLTFESFSVVGQLSRSSVSLPWDPVFDSAQGRHPGPASGITASDAAENKRASSLPRSGWEGSRSGRRRRSFRNLAGQRRDVSPLRLGPCCRQDRPTPNQSGAACIGFAGCAGGLVSEAPTTLERERLFQCGLFWLWRLADNLLSPSVPRVLLCIEGAGQVEHGGANYAFGKGDVLLGGRRVSYAGADELWVGLLRVFPTYFRGLGSHYGQITSVHPGVRITQRSRNLPCHSVTARQSQRSRRSQQNPRPQLEDPEFCAVCLFDATASPAPFGPAVQSLSVMHGSRRRRVKRTIYTAILL
jgi:hypothetical protein